MIHIAQTTPPSARKAREAEAGKEMRGFCMVKPCPREMCNQTGLLTLGFKFSEKGHIITFICDFTSHVLKFSFQSSGT